MLFYYIFRASLTLDQVKTKPHIRQRCIRPQFINIATLVSFFALCNREIVIFCVSRFRCLFKSRFSYFGIEFVIIEKVVKLYASIFSGYAIRLLLGSKNLAQQNGRKIKMGKMKKATIITSLALVGLFLSLAYLSPSMTARASWTYPSGFDPHGGYIDRWTWVVYPSEDYAKLSSLYKVASSMPTMNVFTQPRFQIWKPHLVSQ